MNCCDYQCNQGRNCPVRQIRYEASHKVVFHERPTPFIAKVKGLFVRLFKKAKAK